MKTTIVITSISSSKNPVLNNIAQKNLEHRYQLIVVGDNQSPDHFKLNGCDFYSITKQQQTGFSLSKLLPANHYARKNLGYLIAMRDGASVIIETDDDNYTYPEFWNTRTKKVEAYLYENTGWLNVYRLFSDKRVWPRGFSLPHLSYDDPPASAKTTVCLCPIQQGLADIDPDVDAIYRLTLQEPIQFKQRIGIAVGPGAWCPFNSQNTTWFSEVFPLLYLPSSCNFRLTDIWRSLIAQRICWENGWNILFHSPTVWQERNAHNLMTDFRDELPGYLYNHHIAEALAKLSLHKGIEFIEENMKQCYRVFIDMRLLDAEELTLLNAWFHDIHTLNANVD